MKKEYLAPEMLIHRVILERFMGDSEVIDNNNPFTGDDWGEDQGAKKGSNSWANPSDNIWED